MVTRDTDPLRLLTQLTDLLVPCCDYVANPFTRLKRFCIAELYFRCPYCTDNVHPIVSRRALQRFPRIDWAVHVFLSLPIIFSGGNCGVAFGPLLLPLLFSLLFMRDLRWVHEFVFSKIYRTEYAFVLLELS